MNLSQGKHTRFNKQGLNAPKIRPVSTMVTYSLINSENGALALTPKKRAERALSKLNVYTLVFRELYYRPY